ncbi:MAG: hypothetical protein NTV58_08435 [Deltaproteobacteria bacterium]|nr:hypothetical protein [Deltaproteobacteria bacterium]
MKKITLTLFTLFFCMVCISPITQAADNANVLLAIENTKTNLRNLVEKSAGSKEYQDDIITAQNYLNLAESEYKKNIGILGNLKDEAEPTIRHYTDMANITVAIVMSRIEKANQIREGEEIDKSILKMKSKIKVFDDKNAEIERFKAESGSTRGTMDSVSKELVALKSENALLKKDIMGKEKTIGDLMGDNKKIKDDLNGIVAQKGVAFVQVQSKLASATKTRDFLVDISKLGQVTRISTAGATVVIPRNYFVKTAKKGPELVPGAEKIAGDIAAVVTKYPEYRLDLKVYGYGTPQKNEDIKATEAMAIVIKKLLLEKGKINASFLDAAGAGTSPALFPKDAGNANRRVEITFTYKTSPL